MRGVCLAWLRNICLVDLAGVTCRGVWVAGGCVSTPLAAFWKLAGLMMSTAPPSFDKPLKAASSRESYVPRTHCKHFWLLDQFSHLYLLF